MQVSWCCWRWYLDGLCHRDARGAASQIRKAISFFLLDHASRQLDMDPIRRRRRSIHGGSSCALPVPTHSHHERSQAKPRRVKRRKTNIGKAAAAAGHHATRASTSLSGLLDVLQHGLTAHTVPEMAHETGNQGENDGFESTMEGLLPEYLEARQSLWAQSSDVTLSVRLYADILAWCSCIFAVGCSVCQDDNKGVGELVRPLSRFEIARILVSAKQRVTSPSEWFVLRKLQLQQVSIAVH